MTVGSLRNSERTFPLRSLYRAVSTALSCAWSPCSWVSEGSCWPTGVPSIFRNFGRQYLNGRLWVFAGAPGSGGTEFAAQTHGIAWACFPVLVLVLVLRLECTACTTCTYVPQTSTSLAVLLRRRLQRLRAELGWSRAQSEPGTATSRHHPSIHPTPSYHIHTNTRQISPASRCVSPPRPWLRSSAPKPRPSPTRRPS